MGGSINNLIDRVFSDKYVHADVNIVQLVMYRAAYPFAVLLRNLHLSPNLITSLSLVFSLLAFVALAFDESWGWFSILWASSVLLDFCDGTVARMTGKVSKQAFRYDHMSDLFKIFLLFLGTGLRYDTTLVWGVTATVLFLFLYFMILTHDIIHVRKLLDKARPVTAQDGEQETVVAESVETARVRIRDRYRVVAWLVKFELLYKTWRLLWGPLTTISGHTLLLFFLLPHGPNIAVICFAYLGLIAAVGTRSRIAELLATPKP